MHGEGRRGNSRQVAEEELGKQETARRAPPLPLPQRVIELDARQPRVCRRPRSGKRGGGAAEETTEDTPERAGARGPARMALTIAPPGGAPQPSRTASPLPQWPPPTTPRRPGRPRSGHRAGAPEDQQVGGVASRKCPLLRPAKTQRAGTAWSSCLQAELRVAWQPVRARQTRSTHPGESLL